MTSGFRRRLQAWLFGSLCAATGLAAHGGEADVVAATAIATGPDTYSFDVTVRHADEGWSHYADRFEVLGPGNETLGTRKLLHPHVQEQPFTRSLDGVHIPPGMRKISVRAGDKVHGYGGESVAVELPERR